MKEASILIGKTPKTIKNYIKRGVIRNFFQVEGKYGTEYKISVRDLEPLGIVFFDILRDDYQGEGKDEAPERDIPGEIDDFSTDNDAVSTPPFSPSFDPTPFMERYEEVVMELARSRDRIENLTEENKRLKQDIEEKNMLIQVLTKKGKPHTA
jgi:hypothetical protein